MSDKDTIDPLTMQKLHDSEINCRVECFWDSCWSAYLGDKMNGYVAEEHNLLSFDAALAWLHNEAIRHYPGSEYTKENSDELR